MKNKYIPIPQSKQEAYQIMRSIMQGEYGTEGLVGFLTFCRTDNTSQDILLGFLDGLRDSAVYQLDTVRFSKPMLDLAGTGGDGKHTANISTLAALICVATGLVTVAKYGNRSASGVCGSMDVLEAVGLPIELLKDEVVTQLEQFGFAPLFARSVYPGAKFVAEARARIAGPTLFNLLFPLARPIRGELRYVFGFAKTDSLQTAVEMLVSQPKTRCILVRGADGTDEVSVTGNGKTRYVLIDHGKVSEGVLDCQSLFSIHPVDLTLLQISSKNEAVDVFQRALRGKSADTRIQAIQTAAIVNAAIALFVALERGEKDVRKTMKYVDIARRTLESGNTGRLVERLRLIHKMDNKT